MARWMLGLVVAALAATLGCSGPANTAAPASPEPTPATALASPPPVETSAPTTRRDPPRGPALRYVALGDSLASGMGGQTSYADAYRRLLQRRTGSRVELTNLARPGWTSGQLLDALRTDETFRAAVSQADVITVNVGGNDIIGAVLRTATKTCGGADGLRCVRETTAGFRSRWRAIIDELGALRASPAVPLLTFDLYTPLLPPAVRTEELLGQLDAMNATITASDGAAGVAVAPVARSFAAWTGPSLISTDGLHPSAAGHRLIAQLLLDLGIPSRG